MIPDLKPFAQLADEIEDERGPLTLLALLEREDEQDRWDLIVSAPWIAGVTIENIEYILAKMKQYLSPKERESVANIILLRPDEPTVRTIIKGSQPVTSSSRILYPEINLVYINGMLITRGYILATSEYSHDIDPVPSKVK
jgi:hypothetical protein